MSKVIPSQWGVPAKFRARMGESVGRQRVMVEEGHLLLVLHEVPTAGVHARQPRLFWRDPTGAWRSSTQGSGVGALRQAKDFFEVLQAATPLHRTARNLLRTLQEARDIIDDRELINLRDRAGEVERGAELLAAEARDSLEFTSAQQAEHQARLSLELARESHKLNAISAVFLPITALASIFSMTLRSGLETSMAPWLFWLVVAAGVALGFALKARLVDRSRPQ